MAFKFNFTNQNLDIEDTEENQQLETSLNDLHIQEQQPSKIPSKEYDITSSRLPQVIQADKLEINQLNSPIYKRTLANVRFEIAQQDSFLNDESEKQVMSMLSLNGNLI
ncbi:unnamed protein product [Rhizopus stolonifer]